MDEKSSGQHHSSGANHPQRQHRFYNRTKTGCITCKIRKVRCDQQKPSCNRCTSTGRKCDGYATNTKDPLRRPVSNVPVQHQTVFEAVAIPQHIQIPFPTNNEQEVRSYRFFLDVTAPSIAGVFDVDFWMTDLPRTCYIDPAIWHAVVSLGAVHEERIKSSRGTTSDSKSTAFAIRQFNAAISHLVRGSSSPPTPQEKWRALVASVLFMYQCGMQGLYSNSNVHLSAAKKLVQELLGHKRHVRRSDSAHAAGPDHAPDPPIPMASTPVPYESLFSIVANLNIHAQALLNVEIIECGSFLSNVDAHNAWRFYRAPSRTSSSTPCRHDRCLPSRATSANLIRAGRAFESLLNALITQSQRDATDVARLVVEGDQNLLETLKRRQQPYARAYDELGIAIRMFMADSIDCTCFGPEGSTTTSKRSHKKAIDALRLHQATCYPLFIEPPVEGSLFPETYHPLRPKDTSKSCYDNVPSCMGAKKSPPDSKQALERHFEHTLLLAESLLQDQSPRERTADASDFAPPLATTKPLFIMSHVSGVSVNLRRRLITLLRDYPRQDALWDSSFVAALAELTLKRESGGDNALAEGQGANEGTFGKAREQAPRPEEKQDDPTRGSPLADKVYGVSVAFMDTRTARVTVQTWEQWLGKNSGRDIVLRW